MTDQGYHFTKLSLASLNSRKTKKMEPQADIVVVLSFISGIKVSPNKFFSTVKKVLSHVSLAWRNFLIADGEQIARELLVTLKGL